MSDSTASIVRNLELELRRRITAGVKAGHTIPEIEAEMRLVMEQIAPAGRLRTLLEESFDATRRAVIDELRLDFINQHVPGDFPLTNEAIADTLNGWSRMESVMEDRLIQTIQRTVNTGRTADDAANEIAHVLGVARHQAETLANTGLAQVSRAARIEVGLKGGLDRLRYAGPASQRPFCIYLLEQSRRGVTWTIDQIRAMDNGQRLPVLTSCGGYGCTHRFVFVVP